MPKPTDTEGVEDHFLDEHLFAVTVRTPWYDDIENDLAIGKLPKHLSLNEQK